MRSRVASLLGSALFLVVAPGTVAGFLPWLITGWRFNDDMDAPVWLRAAGLLFLLLGALALVECFVRFAWQGSGTPAPIAPPQRLVVTGLYRHVRNPMYVAILSLLLGQALFLGQPALLAYAALIWAAFHLFVLAYEEPTLRASFPDDYATYVKAVPRWIPRLRPWRGS